MTIPWAMVPVRSSQVELVVRGRVARDAGDVRIRLETADGAAVAEAAVDPTGHGHGVWFPFESRFEIPRAGPGREAGLYVAVIDGDGTTLGSIRRRFTASLLLDVTAAGSRPAEAMVEPTRERSFGNDGLMGGIVFGVPMAERNSR